MEEKQKHFNNRWIALNGVLAVILLLLFRVNLPIKIYPETGTWYAFLRGNSIYVKITLIIEIPFLALWFAVIVNKKFRKRISESRLVFIAQVCAVVVLTSGSIILPQYYDAVYLTDDAGYTFVASRLFGEQKSYALDDIVQCHMESTSHIWVQMSDGERIYISYGITTYSQNLNNNHSSGELEYEIHNLLAENNVLLTISNRDKIQKEIEKYQGRSNLRWWHGYLPQIVANIP